MVQLHPFVAVALGVLFCASPLRAAEEETREMTGPEKRACQERFHIDAQAHQPTHGVATPVAHTCSIGERNKFQIPDPKCTPGAINPSLTLEVLTDPDFRTACLRDEATSAEKKKETYAFYGITEPRENSGKNQTCELDHFISLELGGADTLDNIWPQCGPDGAELEERDFKQKDMVEDYLAFLVKNRRMSLGDAQKGIVQDWTQFLIKARVVCPGGKCELAKLPPN